MMYSPGVVNVVLQFVNK